MDDDDGIDDETEYEAWKIRELNRIKKHKEVRDADDKLMCVLWHVYFHDINCFQFSMEQERWKNMTEEERLAELAKQPKQITNDAEKGKYKFMQKYYHRGAFYLDQARLIQL